MKKLRYGFEAILEAIFLSDIFMLAILLKYSEIGSKEASSNAGASTIRSKERVLSGLLQALFNTPLSINAKLERIFRVLPKIPRQQFSVFFGLYRNLMRNNYKCRHIYYEKQEINAIRHLASAV